MHWSSYFSKSARSGLTFPVSRVLAKLKKGRWEILQKAVAKCRLYIDFFQGSSNIALRKIRIQEDQNQTPKEGEKYFNFMFRKVVCSVRRAEGFSWSIEVLLWVLKSVPRSNLILFVGKGNLFSQCCGAGSGIRCLFVSGIRNSGSQTHIFESWMTVFE
jgi:hypothetical protein